MSALAGDCAARKYQRLFKPEWAASEEPDEVRHDLLRKPAQQFLSRRRKQDVAKRFCLHHAVDIGALAIAIAVLRTGLVRTPPNRPNFIICRRPSMAPTYLARKPPSTTRE